MADAEQNDAVTTVAIVDDDERLVAALVRDLGARGLQVHTAQSAQAALKLLETHNVDVMVTDLRMSGRDGIDLIRAVGILSPNTRSILMSAFATAKDYKVAMELGAVDVLGKPFTPDELHAALEKAIERDNSVRGDMRGLSLTDVLSLFHSGKRSITIRIGGSSSAIHMSEGEIAHAEHGRLTGKDALLSLLSAPLGRVRTGALESNERTIKQPFRSLLDEIVATLAKHRTGRWTRDFPAVGRDETKEKRKEVAKMTGPTNMPNTGGAAGGAPRGSTNRATPMLIGGVVLVAAGILMLALGIKRGSDVDPAGSEPAAGAVNEISIDITDWLNQPDEPKAAEPAKVAATPEPEPAPEPAAEPTDTAKPEPAVASRKSTRSSSRRRARRPTRRAPARPAVAATSTAAPEPPPRVEPAPAPEPRKPMIGTIAAKQPAIGVVRTSKPVIGTVQR